MVVFLLNASVSWVFRFLVRHCWLVLCDYFVLRAQPMGVAKIFQKGGGGGRGHTVSNIIVMAFSLRNIVGCLLKEGLQITGTPGPPSLRPCQPLHHSSQLAPSVLAR